MLGLSGVCAWPAASMFGTGCCCACPASVEPMLLGLTALRSRLHDL